jgi:hypothetical protein
MVLTENRSSFIRTIYGYTALKPSAGKKEAKLIPSECLTAYAFSHRDTELPCTSCIYAMWRTLMPAVQPEAIERIS